MSTFRTGSIITRLIMYKSIIFTPSIAFDLTKARIFVPTLTACILQSIEFLIPGAATQKSLDEFEIKGPFIVLDSSLTALLQADNQFIIHVDYHYKSSEHEPVCKELADNVLSQTLSSPPATPDEIDIHRKRTEIFVKHYINGIFAFDSGLYKEAVLNFGTVLEVMLNTELNNISLGGQRGLIATTTIAPGLRDNMTFIRECRNKVHANRIADLGDISRLESRKCRMNLDEILTEVVDLNAYT